MNGSELLIKAADLLEEDGWIQGNYQDNNDAHCAVGAMLAVYRDNNDFGRLPYDEGKPDPYDEAYAKLLDCISEGNKAGITWWNDEPGQTAENVISTMRACANGTA